MKAILLAAGRGSRLGALTADNPKCMVEIAGQPLINLLCRELMTAGFDEIGIVRGYQADRINIPGCVYFDNSKWAQTNMVRSLMCAGEWLESATCIVSYTDILYPAETARTLAEARGDIVIPYNIDWLRVWKARLEDVLSDAETFRTNSDGILAEIGGRAASIDEIKGQYMGLLKIEPAGWSCMMKYLDRLPAETVDKLDVTTLLRGLLREGATIQTVPIEGKWFEFDNEDDIRAFTSSESKFGLGTIVR